MPIVSGYVGFGGVYSESASLAHVLASAGIRIPGTDEPLSEAMVFGIGGGIGAGYILFEFQQHHLKVLVMGFGHQWQYTTRFYQALCDRINVSVSMPETGSRKAAAQMLNDALAQDRPAVAWMDRAHLPYYQLPEAMQGHLGHIVAVCGQEGDDYWIDDRACAPFRVPAETFNLGRARISSYKSRLLLVDSIAPFDLAAAVRSGLEACIEHLSSDSDSFSLPTFRKWARTMTDTRNKKGWPVVFADRRGLYGALCSIFEGIELNVGEGALRGLYARFLREAEVVTGNTRLAPVADRYDDLAHLWHAFAEAALPDEPFAQTKALLRQRHEALMQGGDAWQTAVPLSAELAALSARNNPAFPLTDAAVNNLFANLQTHLTGIYEAEVEAHESLRAALG